MNHYFFTQMKNSYDFFANREILCIFAKEYYNLSHMQSVQLNQAQLHILNMASHIKTEQSLELLKQQLASFYAKLIDEQMDELWDSGKWNEQKLADLRDSHFRTPY